MRLIHEFRQFILRGNAVDLAIGVVIGVAFGSLVTAMVEDLLTPLIAAIVGEPDFSGITFEINGSVFRIGSFINALIAFLSVAVVIFFFVVKPMNLLLARSRREPPADPTTKKCPECLSEIPLEARRCAFCTSEQSMAGMRA